MFRVLYVDDEPGLLEIGKIYLETFGDFAISTIESAPAALQLLQAEQFDAIIADYLMPVMDGLELLKKVRQRHGNIPFILFTGRGREEVVITALNLGADFYLQKGGDPQAQFAELAHKTRQAVERRRIEAALEESESRYRAVIESQTELICRFAPDRTLLFVNGAFCAYYGRTAEELVGSRSRSRIHPEDREAVGRLFSSLRPENPVGSIEHRILMDDGSVRWQHWTDRAIFDDRGIIMEYQSVGRDISDRKVAEDELRAAYEQLTGAEEELRDQFDEAREREQAIRISERKLQGIVHGSPIPQFVIDRDHRVISWNRALEEATGVRAGEVLGTTDAWKAFYPSERPVLADLLVNGNGEKVPAWYPGKYSPARYIDGAFEATDFFPLAGKGGAWLHFTATLIRDEEGNPIGAVETLEDITDRRKAEEATADALSRLDSALKFIEAVVSAIPTPIFYKDREGRYLGVNDAFLEVMGHTPEYYRGKTVAELWPDEYADVYQEKDLELMRKAEKQVYEFRVLDKNGIVRPVIYGKNVFRDRNGEVAGIVGAFVDITEEKKAEEAVQRILQEWQSTFNAIADPVFLLDRDGRILRHNRALERFLKKSGEEITGRFCFEVMHGTAYPLDGCPFVRTRDSRQRESIEVKMGDRWMIAAVDPILSDTGEVTGCVHLLTDITARKAAEEALRGSEERYRTLADASPDLIYIIDREDRVVYVNRLGLAMLNRSIGEVAGRPRSELFPGDVADRQYQSIRQVFSEGRQVQIESMVPLPGGESWQDTRLVPLFAEDGSVAAVMGVSRDITRRKKAETALAESEERYRQLVEHSPDAVAVHRRGRFVYVNPACVRLFGATDAAEIVGQPVLDFVHPDFKEIVLQRIHTVSDLHGDVPNLEETFLRLDGTPVDVEVAAMPVMYDGEPAIQIAFRSISGRRS